MQYYQCLQEKVTTLQITSNVAIKKVIYSIPIQDLPKNALLHITGAFEVTNPYKPPVMIGSNIVLSAKADNPEGDLIDIACATNVTKDIHHGVVVKARQFLTTKAYPGIWYLNLVGWAMSYGFNPGDALIVEQHYGHLDVVICDF